MIGSGESEKYLGIQINPWKGVMKPPLQEMLDRMVKKIEKARLKPSQKIEILKSYAIPRLIYIADHGMVRKKQSSPNVTGAYGEQQRNGCISPHRLRMDCCMPSQ